MAIKELFNSTWMLRLRSILACVRRRIDPYYRVSILERRFNALALNACYEFSPGQTWQPEILGLEETLQWVISKHSSLSRYGDGEFALMAGQNMSFEVTNRDMAHKLKSILRNPLPNCLNCVPNIFGSLSRYRDSDIEYWRAAAVWMRPILRKCIMQRCNLGVAQNCILGDPQVSRAYLGVGNPEIAPKIFDLWKGLFEGKDLLIVEGRFSRLGVGNDLFSGAKRVRRIWCPATGAYSQYERIKAAVCSYASKEENSLVLIALGATATILAYDLAKLGFWALDVGHIDVEYMWMKMGVKDKCPIPGRYVNECLYLGREKQKIIGEEVQNNVLEIID